APDAVLVLQGPQLLESPVAHEAGPVGGPHDRVVQGVDDVVAGVPPHPPPGSRATASAISSGVTNSICSPVVMVLNSSSEKIPFSPVSMKTLFRLWPVGRPREGSRGRKASPAARGAASSKETSCRATGCPPRRISPNPIPFPARGGAGLT